jgi:MtN3 and saliva related transmembrane protein
MQPFREPLNAAIIVTQIRTRYGQTVNFIDLIGWTSSVVLLATIGRQVYTQWKTRATAGVSKWLFVGQLTASTGYTIYSVLLHNWVFMTSNIALLGTALVGQALFLRNRRLQNARQATST